MRFSVIIPSYNKANAIGRAIESVLNQTFQDFEIIVVENNSSDNSLEVIKSIASEKITLAFEKQQGVSYARNTGWRMASGEYICFLDADDTYEPRNLYELNLLIKKFPNAGIYANRFKMIDVRGEVKLQVLNKDWLLGNCFIHNNFFEAFVLGQMPVNTNTVCISKRHLNKQLGFDPRLTYGEDIDLWARLFLDKAVIIGEYYGSTYYQNALNRSIEKSHLESYKLLLNKFEDLYQYHPSLKSYKGPFEAFKGYVVFGVALDCLKKGDTAAAKEWLADSRIEHYPKQKSVMLLRFFSRMPNAINKLFFMLIKKIGLVNV
jgi:glycosyltransferase involved in cell wall biosynthesis